LFYQHNPYGWNWGNMHWGHAVSKDLFHWKEQPIALYPKAFGDWAFSGSALVDKDNTSGFGKGKKPPLVLAYTSTGRGECIAYSNDSGQTWREYEGNPVVKHKGRDPRLLWHAPSKSWVMAVYDEGKGQAIAFYTSPDLKKWTFASKIAGFFECPDLFEIAVKDDAKKTKWILYGADGLYMVGSFDGKTFKKESGKHRLWNGNFYAAQTFSNAPDGRRIQIGWNNAASFPGMPFNQQMTVPVELTLAKTEEGFRLRAKPVREIEYIAGKKQVKTIAALKPGKPNYVWKGDTFDMSVAFHVDDGKPDAVGVNVRGVPVTYDLKKRQITCRGVTAQAAGPAKGKVRMRILVDRGSIEIFDMFGESAMSIAVIPSEKDRNVEVFCRGGAASVDIDLRPLKSAWK
jgi:fructan beta-fructosidase